MKQQNPQKLQKSTILLVLFIFLLFYAGLIFRAGINTLYFTQDATDDYSPIEAVVTDLRLDPDIQPGEDSSFIPVFTFDYLGETTTLSAPNLSFSPGKKEKDLSFVQGEKYPLWLHKIQGKLLLPPTSGRQEIGRSQMVISAVCIILAIAVWTLRNTLAVRTARKQFGELQ